jgi:hypothetical protein
MSPLQEAPGIHDVFQHVSKENDIEWSEPLQNCGSERLLINLKAACSSSRGAARIGFDPDDGSIASLRDYAGHRARATAYIQHAGSHRDQIGQHVCYLLRFVHVSVVA